MSTTNSQPQPPFITGREPTATEWNRLFAGKVDGIGGFSSGQTLESPNISTIVSATPVTFLIAGNPIPFPGPQGPYISVAGGTLDGPLAFSPLRTWSGSSLATNPWYTQATTWTGTNSGSGPSPANYIEVIDEMNSGVGPGNTAIGLNVAMISRGLTKIGYSNAIDSLMLVDGTTGNTPAVALGGYSAGRFTAEATVNDNGTNGTRWGQLFGTNVVAELFTGATYWSSIVASEFDIGAQTGTQVDYKVGVQITLLNGDAVQGTLGDVGLNFANQYAQGSGAGWSVAIGLGTTGFFPLAATGTIMSAGTAGGGMTVAHGIDFHNITVTSDYLRMGTEFRVDPNGSVFAKTVTAQLVEQANGVALSGAATTAYPNITASGSDTDVGLNILTKGIGPLFVYGENGAVVSLRVTPVATADGYIDILPGIAASQMMQISTRGTGNNILLGGPIGGGALSNSATDGFPAMPFTASTPTGVPTNNSVGAAFELNLNTKVLNVYVPGVGWYHATLSAGAG